MRVLEFDQIFRQYQIFVQNKPEFVLLRAVPRFNSKYAGIGWIIGNIDWLLAVQLADWNFWIKVGTLWYGRNVLFCETASSNSNQNLQFLLEYIILARSAPSKALTTIGREIAHWFRQRAKPISIILFIGRMGSCPIPSTSYLLEMSINCSVEEICAPEKLWPWSIEKGELGLLMLRQAMRNPVYHRRKFQSNDFRAQWNSVFEL